MLIFPNVIAMLLSSFCSSYTFVFLNTLFHAWIVINALLFHVGSLYLWSFRYVFIVSLSI